MLRELMHPLALSLMAPGRSLAETERLAAVIVIWVILLLSMAGYTLVIDGLTPEGRDAAPVRTGTFVPALCMSGCGILAADSAGRTRTFLQ